MSLTGTWAVVSRPIQHSAVLCSVSGHTQELHAKLLLTSHYRLAKLPWTELEVKGTL